MLPTLGRLRRRELRAVDVSASGLSRLHDVALPLDARTASPFVLSGEASSEGVLVVPEPERNLEAMLLDAFAREVLPELYARAGDADLATALRDAPASNDLYAAYRLRERLLEICPPGTRASGTLGQAVRACRHTSRLIRPAPTARARPSWDERRALIARATRGVSREAVRTEEGAQAMLSVFTRLSALARAIR